MTEFASQFEHERYEELCAMAAAGALTPAESERLSAHMEGCAECKEAYGQYRRLVSDGMPLLADEFSAPAAEERFDQASALNRLMLATQAPAAQPAASLTLVAARKTGWNRGWVRGIAAAILLAAATGAYWAGSNSAVNRLRNASTGLHSAETTLAHVTAEKQMFQEQILVDQQKVAALEQQVLDAKNDAAKLDADAQADTARIASMTDAMDAAKKDADARLTALAAERDASLSKLHDAESRFQTVQDELNTMRNQHQQDAFQLASLETRVNNLNADLNDQNRRAKTDEQYLASDKDIRDLIGARNLYIADIIDVNGSGQSAKPFGRVFYTKTKSLIFYAYDLDHQPGMRRSATFQVWGRTNAGSQKPINLGILYMDSETNRRWTLRVDNPEQLARLDSVFVTIEPHEQTDKPTGKPFLYASLRRVANHP